MSSDSSHVGNTADANSSNVQMEVGDSEREDKIATPPIDYRDPSLRPVYKLSVKLIDTYKHINKVVFCFN